jgi:trimeric autotransporter adhesin
MSTNGTAAGTLVVKDIYRAGLFGGNPNFLTVFNNTLYFSAYDLTNGVELWKSDGTEGGTQLVRDIYTGSTSSTPQYLTVFNNRLFFAATTSSLGRELWSSDGTSVGTTLVKDIYPGGTGSGNSASPEDLIVYNNRLYFNAYDNTRGAELWSSDGTSAGTNIVSNLILEQLEATHPNLKSLIINCIFQQQVVLQTEQNYIQPMGHL